MKRALLALCLIGALGLSIWFAWSLGRRSQSSPQATVSPLTPLASHERATKPRLNPGSLQESPEDFIDDEWQRVNESSPLPYLAGALPDEATLQFGSEQEYREALDTLYEAGVPVIDTIDGLWAVRIRTSSPAWRNIGENAREIGHNFPVGLPKPPTKDSIYSSQVNEPYGQNLLSSLGVDPGTNTRWGEGITIAVLDSGVMGNHQSLQKATIRTTNGDLSRDSVGHGTGVASLIVNQDGIAPGLAPAATVISIPVLNELGLSDTFTVASGIVTAVDGGAQVINMSLGAYGDNPALRAAINYALERNVAIVAAVGNDGAGQVAYPAAYPEVIAVGADDFLKRPASFTNYGEAVDISAPGVGLVTAWSGDQYGAVSGTSFSTPLVSAAVAVALQHNPHLTPRQAAQVVIDAADDIAAPGDDPFSGAGTLNMQRVMDYGQRGIYDAAVTGHNINTATDGTAYVQVDIGVENRGTEYLNGLQLHVNYEGHEETYYLTALNPGESTLQTLLLDPAALSNPAATEITSTVTLSSEDLRPANDTQASVISITSSEE